MSERLDDHEDLWGYGKRLRFVRTIISDSFATRSPDKIRVLDIGCGNGSQLAMPLSKHGYDLTGIDTDERSIEKAQSLSWGVSNAHFVFGQLTDLAPKSRFDVVILSEVLEHLNEPKDLLALAVDRMERDGVLIVTVPNGYGEFEIGSWLFRGLRVQRLVDAIAKDGREVVGSTENQECGHIQFFTRKRLNRLFRSCGLTIMREASGSFLAGPFVGHTLARSRRFIGWNARITDKLPFSLASSWYFALRRDVSKSRPQSGTDS
jgi:2-polyprenyl-3-methyl-5-hydroxy-6-metoxy-1,4-benzoquinol methylase